MAHAPLDRAVARPTDAPPLAHEAGFDAAVPDVEPPAAEAPLLPPEELPRHVAIIMDGNRRWARARGLADFEGHAAGVEAIRGLLQHAVRRGVPMLTLYAFSRENWARSDDEVSGLFDLLGQAIRNETDELREQGVRVRLLGRLEELPDATRSSIGDALDQTAEGTRLQLNIAWNYAGRTEIVDAFRRLLAGCHPRGGRRARHQRGALHHGPARPRPRDPDRRRVPHQQLPDLAVRLRRARVRRVPVAGLRPRVVRHRAARVRPSHPPVRPVGPAPMLRTPRPLRDRHRPAAADRARASARRPWRSSWPSSRRSAPWEAFRLLRMAGYPSLHVFGTVLAVAMVLEAAWRPGGDKGMLLVGAGAVLAGIGAFARTDSRGRPDRVDGDRVRRRLRRGSSRSSSRWPPTGPPSPRARAFEPLGAERGWVLLLIFGVWSFDTGAFLVGRQIGRHKFLTHLSPSKSIEGVVGGVVATTIVTALMLAGLGQNAGRRARPRPAARHHGAGGRPRRVDAQARGGRQGLRDA